ncbi:MAG: single-stranded DNA-binding protein [Candidatus Aenigmatarchaeota archaeon]
MINKVILLGRVGNRANMRIYEGGIRKAWFSLVTNEKYHTTKGEVKERTVWHTVVCWGGLADFVYEKLKKGDLVYLEGKLSYYESKEKTYVEIIAIDLKLLSSPYKDFQKITEPEDSSLGTSLDIPEEEIPF